MASGKKKANVGICPNCRRRLKNTENHIIGTIRKTPIFKCAVEMEVQEYE